VTKLGICYNPQCSLPDRKTDHSKLMDCTRCLQANYCSLECQRATWSYHKAFCVDCTSKTKTVFLDKKVDKSAMSKALAQNGLYGLRNIPQTETDGDCDYHSKPNYLHKR
jgi:hypothetical protein